MMSPNKGLEPTKLAQAMELRGSILCWADDKDAAGDDDGQAGLDGSQTGDKTLPGRGRAINGTTDNGKTNMGRTGHNGPLASRRNRHDAALPEAWRPSNASGRPADGTPIIDSGQTMTTRRSGPETEITLPNNGLKRARPDFAWSLAA